MFGLNSRKVTASLATAMGIADMGLALSPDGKCRVLAMRGGGVHGAFEVGVLQAFVEKLDPLDIHYDYVSGVSIGAINASMFSLFDYGDEKSAVDLLLSLYKDNLPQDFWDFWPTYFIEPFWKQSFVDPSKMAEILTKLIGDKTFKRKISV